MFSRDRSFKKRIFSRKIAARPKPKIKKSKQLGKMMPFVPQLRESVEEGRTIFSFRYKIHSFYPRPGELFKSHCGSQPIAGLYRCLKRVKSSIGEVKRRFWTQIGVASPEAYEELMKLILKSEDLDYEKSGYLYVFERIE